jgi:hypothetical protein
MPQDTMRPCLTVPRKVSNLTPLSAINAKHPVKYFVVVTVIISTLPLKNVSVLKYISTEVVAVSVVKLVSIPRTVIHVLVCTSARS